MSIYQGDCGYCDASGCCSAPVLASYEAQLTSGQTSSLRAAAVIYAETVRTIRAGGTPRFASNADYNQYKKARALASGSSHIACRPPPSAAVRQIEAIGCPRCVVPIGSSLIISNIFDSTVTGVTAPVGFIYYFDISWNPYVGASSYTYTTTYPSAYEFVSIQETYIRLFIDWNYAGDFTITITGVNDCGRTSVSGIGTAPCFLAGSLVTLADGRTKPIEEIVIGDTVRGAFGETNTVVALHRPLLGTATMCRINEEHSTTSHHPHISPDRGFYCLHPAVVSSVTYGREHAVLNAEGKTEMRMLHGLRPDRIQPLALGQNLKTIDGLRVVATLEEYSLPPETQLYNLVVGGSHTYHVDGYAVTGWPREDDFDYDSWSLRT